MPSVLWHCWLGGRKGIRPVKNWAVGCWRGYLSGARCRLAYGPADGPLPLTVSCFSKIQIGFTFLVPAHLGSPGQRAVKRVCVCACSSWHPTNSVKAPKAKMITMITVTKISNYTVPGKNDTPIKIALSILSQILWTKTMKHINKDWHIFMSILLAFKRPVCHWKYEISNTVTLVWSMFFKQVIAKRIDL